MLPITTTDQMGNKLRLPGYPQRIISLVPSQTELLHDLGLDKEVVGITKFCVHPPEWRKTKAIIGGTKNADLSRMESLTPDLIIGNKEENDRATIEALQQKYPVWMSDVITVGEALTMIRGIGQITGREAAAHQIADRINQSMAGIVPAGKEALYLIWHKPWMGAAHGTFIHHMMEKAGYRNCLRHLHRYPELDESILKTLNPEVILLSSEPYPFKDKHKEELQSLFPEATILLVDGELFSWYGSRMLHFAPYTDTLRQT
ncbi:MAG: helical backbone metal receptor [Cyclobacteriaceae bacterium]|nr:helical backbone metal receptor [Cyclobacteriaceae bacterium]